MAQGSGDAGHRNRPEQRRNRRGRRRGRDLGALLLQAEAGKGGARAQGRDEAERGEGRGGAGALDAGGGRARPRRWGGREAAREMREEVSERKEMGAWRWVRQGHGRGEGIGRRGGRSRGRWGSRGSGEALAGSGRARGGGQGMRGREIDGESWGLGLEGLGGPWEAGPVEKEVARGLAGQLGWALSLSLISIRKEIERGKGREG